MLLEVQYGKEIFDDRHASVTMFAVPCKQFNTFEKEIHIAQAAHKENIPIQRHSSQGGIHAYADGHAYREDLGKWTSSVFTVPEGMMLKIWADNSPGFGRRIQKCGMFIRTRENGPYQELRFRLTNHPNARYQYATIKGRFDILTLDQAKLRGAKLFPGTDAYYAKRAVEELVTVNKIQDEVEALPTVKARVVKRKSGDEVIVKTARKARRIELED